MRNQRKGAIIERVEHHTTKRTGVIRLDKRGMWFFAREVDGDVNSPPFESKDGSAVREWLMKQLARTTADDRLEWLPVVKIEYGGEKKGRYRDESQVHGESMELEVNRFYIALSKDKREWRKLTWEECEPNSSTVLPENDRYAASERFRDGPRAEQQGYRKPDPFRLPQFNDGGGYGDSTTYLPFTADLWRGLLQVCKQIAAARSTLKELVGTKQGVGVLGEIGAGKSQLLLAAGPQRKDDSAE